jgi:hypothetical protein
MCHSIPHFDATVEDEKAPSAAHWRRNWCVFESCLLLLPLLPSQLVSRGKRCHYISQSSHGLSLILRTSRKPFAAMTVAIKESEVEKAAPSCDQTAAHNGVTQAADVPHPQHAHNSKHERHSGAKKQARETRKLTTAYVVAGVVVVIVALVLGGHRAAQVRLSVCPPSVHQTCRPPCQLHTLTPALSFISSSFVDRLCLTRLMCDEYNVPIACFHWGVRSPVNVVFVMSAQLSARALTYQHSCGTEPHARSDLALNNSHQHCVTARPGLQWGFKPNPCFMLCAMPPCQISGQTLVV